MTYTEQMDSMLLWQILKTFKLVRLKNRFLSLKENLESLLMGNKQAIKITMESIRQRMVEVEQIHRRGKKVAITDTLVKDIGWLFRRIVYLTSQVNKLEDELETISKEKKELSDDNIMADKVKMLMERIQEAEEKMRVTKLEGQPLKRENNLLKQEMKLLQARTVKAERRAKQLAEELKKVEQKEGVIRKKPRPLSPMAKMKPIKKTQSSVSQ